jgi:hypothetical protein
VSFGFNWPNHALTSIKVVPVMRRRILGKKKISYNIVWQYWYVYNATETNIPKKEKIISKEGLFCILHLNSWLLFWSMGIACCLLWFGSGTPMLPLFAVVAHVRGHLHFLIPTKVFLDHSILPLSPKIQYRYSFTYETWHLATSVATGVQEIFFDLE